MKGIAISESTGGAAEVLQKQNFCRSGPVKRQKIAGGSTRPAGDGQLLIGDLSMHGREECDLLSGELEAEVLEYHLSRAPELFELREWNLHPGFYFVAHPAFSSLPLDLAFALFLDFADRELQSLFVGKDANLTLTSKLSGRNAMENDLSLIHI